MSEMAVKAGDFSRSFPMSRWNWQRLNVSKPCSGPIADLCRNSVHLNGF